MTSEIIAVGTELLLGNIVNTNAAYLAANLAELGFDMYYQSVVGDNFGRAVELIKTATKRSDIVIMTGGLGPTPDDLSKEAAAKALGLRLYYDEQSLKQIENYFLSTGRKMSCQNRKQALFPKERCVIFPNENGTAPGCAMTAENGSVVILMPGVPFEMKVMFETYVKPYLAAKSDRAIVSRNITVAGIGESLLASMIPEYINGSDPTVSPYCYPGTVVLRVTSEKATAAEATAKCDETAAKLISIFGKNVCGVDDGSLEEILVRLLTEKKLKLATAESCTAGKISAAITSVPGASSVFDFGASTYSNEMKHRLLSVSTETLDRFGAVSAETAIEMANGILKYANADLGLAVTGVAGPASSENKPVGLVYIALCDKDHVWVEKLMVGKAGHDREKVRNTTVTHALDLARRYLLYHPDVMPGFTDGAVPDIIIPEQAALKEINKQLLQ